MPPVAGSAVAACRESWDAGLDAHLERAAAEFLAALAKPRPRLAPRFVPTNDAGRVSVPRREPEDRVRAALCAQFECEGPLRDWLAGLADQSAGRAWLTQGVFRCVIRQADAFPMELIARAADRAFSWLIASWLRCERHDLQEQLWVELASWLVFSLAEGRSSALWPASAPHQDTGSETRLDATRAGDPETAAGRAPGRPASVEPVDDTASGIAASLVRLLCRVCRAPIQEPGDSKGRRDGRADASERNSGEARRGRVSRRVAHVAADEREAPEPAAVFWDPELEPLCRLVERVGLGRHGRRFLPNSFLSSPAIRILEAQGSIRFCTRAVWTLRACPRCGHVHRVYEEANLDRELEHICRCETCRERRHYHLRARRWALWWTTRTHETRRLSCPRRMAEAPGAHAEAEGGRPGSHAKRGRCDYVAPLGVRFVEKCPVCGQRLAANGTRMISTLVGPAAQLVQPPAGLRSTSDAYVEARLRHCLRVFVQEEIASLSSSLEAGDAFPPRMLVLLYALPVEPGPRLRAGWEIAFGELLADEANTRQAIAAGAQRAYALCRSRPALPTSAAFKVAKWRLTVRCMAFARRALVGSNHAR